MNKESDAELIERLNDVLDIIAAAEHQFARTDAHHDYYSDRFNAVKLAASRLAERQAELLAVREERDALLQKPLDLARLDSIDDGVPDKMLAYYWCAQAQEARAERTRLMADAQSWPIELIIDGLYRRNVNAFDRAALVLERIAALSASSIALTEDKADG